MGHMEKEASAVVGTSGKVWDRLGLARKMNRSNTNVEPPSYISWFIKKPMNIHAGYKIYKLEVS